MLTWFLGQLYGIAYWSGWLGFFVLFAWLCGVVIHEVLVHLDTCLTPFKNYIKLNNTYQIIRTCINIYHSTVSLFIVFQTCLSLPQFIPLPKFIIY